MPRSTIPLIMILGGLGVFLLVALDVMCDGRLHHWDVPVHSALFKYADVQPRTPGSFPTGVLVFAAVSSLGEISVVTSLAVVVGGVLILRRRWRTLVIWIMALVGSGIINPALKSLFRIPRPHDNTFFALNGGFSFPSGHTMAAAISAGALALILTHHVRLGRAGRWAVWGAAGLLSLLVAFALMYIGVHYLTDVVGALFISLAWLGVMRWLLPPNAEKTPPP